MLLYHETPFVSSTLNPSGYTSFFCKERDGGKLHLYVEGKPKTSFGDQPCGLVERGAGRLELASSFPAP
jgi:hypothetical protein